MISVVAVQGSGAASATINLPTTPAAWTSIGDWICNGGSGNELHVAAAYRITDENDAPGTVFSWAFSSAFQASVLTTVYGGTSTSSPIDVVGLSPSCNLGSAGSAVVAPPVTTTVGNDLVVATFAAAGVNNDISLTVGSPLGPVVGQDNTGHGPADFTAFATTNELSPGFGAPGKYGPFTATQAASGESLSVLITAKP